MERGEECVPLPRRQTQGEKETEKKNCRSKKIVLKRERKTAICVFVVIFLSDNPQGRDQSDCHSFLQHSLCLSLSEKLKTRHQTTLGLWNCGETGWASAAAKRF